MVLISLIPLSLIRDGKFAVKTAGFQRSWRLTFRSLGDVLQPPDGTVCMCNYSYQHEDSEFQSGDHVTLVVQRFERDKRQMYDKILSKR